MKIPICRFLVIVCLSLLYTNIYAELVDITQVNDGGAVNAPGGLIGKSLTEQIGAGHGDEAIFNSAVYLIKRDPARSIRRGRQLFQRKFTADQGLGPRVNTSSTGDITQTRALGAGFADSCALCHGRPRGAAGFGGDVATRPDSRDAPHLFGLGLIEQLAEEMTSDLREIRQTAIDNASTQRRRTVTHRLITKGVDFGKITVSRDGTVDTSRVDGVDENLRVLPFFHHGGTASIREFIVGAFKDEMGMQAYDEILCSVTDPVNPVSVTSPAGFLYDPEFDTFERPPACDISEDADGDGVTNEIDMAVLDHMEFYLLNYFKPATYRSTRTTKRGQRLMQEIGCTTCHVPDLVIDSDRRVADVETVYDPRNGIFNDLFATASTQFIVFDDGNQYPLLLPEENQFVVRNIYTDLKRHDLGTAFHEREYDGSVVTEFVTEPLWGVGSTSPYGHDGRSINLDQVIRRHGGEAERSQRAYLRLRSSDQQAILSFLQTLVLFPPDDTASNLNPGNPGTQNPQIPSEHGSILLPALYQIDLGAE